MVKPIHKRKSEIDMLREQRQKLEEATIDFGWAVFEYTPARTIGGYYEQDVPEKWSRVSVWYDTEDEARDWMSRYRPDEGKELRIKRRRLIERKYQEWVMY